jgi:hypothetical protein
MQVKEYGAHNELTEMTFLPANKVTKRFCSIYTL